MTGAGLERFGLRRVEATDVCGDVVFHDPFRQLEDETSAVHAWQAERNAEAREALCSIPGIDALRAGVARHLAADRVAVPKAGGGRWFWPEADDAGDVRRLSMSASLDDAARELVVDASAVPVDGDEIVDWFEPSPDGRLLAVATSSHGDEQRVLALVDVSSRALVGIPVRHVGSVAWLPDASGLYVTRGVAPSGEQPLKRLAFLVPGQTPSRVDAPPAVSDPALRVQVSGDGRFVAVLAAATCVRLLAVHDRSTGDWIEPGFDPDTTFCGAFLGNKYYAVTDQDADAGRLISAAVEDVGDSSRWRDVVPPGDTVLRGVIPVGDGLLVYELDDGTPRLRTISPDGSPRITIALPGELTARPFGRFGGELAGSVPAVVAGDQVLVRAAAPGRASTLWRCRSASGALDELTDPSVQLDELRRERITCVPLDGEEVRYELVVRADLPNDARLPVLVHGYGGFNVASPTGGYLGMFAPWVVAGGGFAFVHLRGDGTFGSGRWREGRRGHKQRSIDDLVVAIEDLHARGRTTPAQTALMGASNGGLVAAAVVVQRPELVHAAAILIPMTDMARLQRERYPEAFVAEYGDPRLPEQARWLRGYSPYHGVEAGRRYPATIIVSGGRDIRTHAWHGRKLAAALLDAADPSTRVLLRVHESCGHETTVTHPDRIAEWLAFLMAEVALPLECGTPERVGR